MAVEPLYAADKATFLKGIRMAEAQDENTLQMIDNVIAEVRMGFFRVLTSARALEVAGYSLVENPTTENEILRVTARNTEVNWATYLLAQRLPNIFMDNRASVGDVFNDEPLTRDSTGLQEFIDNLKEQVDLGLADLILPPDDNAGSVKASSIGNTGDEYKPFKSGTFKGLYPNGENPGGYL